MPPTSLLAPCTYPPAASITAPNSNPSASFFNKTQAPTRSLQTGNGSAFSPYTCRAFESPSSSITEFDLYELLGVQSCSDQSRIKAAYRALHKRCHPDIAGPAGHDMAIILNEAYSVLSDPCSRLAYDKKQAKLEELRGYTGKPLYSVWCGPESEHRAVFVDEVKCVGCLKCALLASKTFAIESAYGRARVVAQWADPEAKVHEAIEACPVDCISVVERSDLASLEFLMSKQPRGNVRVGAGTSVGARVSNIFTDVKKFQGRYAEAMKNAAKQNTKEMDFQREARMSAIQAIRSISNWVYWQPLGTKSYPPVRPKHATQRLPDPDMERLRAAAAARNRAKTCKPVEKAWNIAHTDEYWIPSTQVLPSLIASAGRSEPETAARRINQRRKKDHAVTGKKRGNDTLWRLPALMGTAAAIVVGSGVADRTGEVKEHIGGPLALAIVNSPWSQVALAWVIWYFIGVAMAELVEASQQNKEY